MHRSLRLWDEGLRRDALAGIGMLPEIMVSEDIACGRLVRLLLGYAPPSRAGPLASGRLSPLETTKSGRATAD
jgi:DNA-binding transcriptional LysR family regulator